jgi:predicted Rossmann fold flavoprotein
MRKIVVLGGGASGMAAAIRAAESPDNHITLLERQARVGRKLLATGNGRCNLTNTGAEPARYHGAEPAFAAPALRAWPPARVLEFFAGLGLRTVTEYGGRVYPASDHASSVLDVLRLALERPNITLRTGTAAETVAYEDGGFTVGWADGSVRADRLIVACGGCAGQKLGGVPDGYALLGRLGHSRTALRPALTSLRTAPAYPRALKGIRCDAAVRLLRGGTLLSEARGDVLFTETGLSGTAIFDISRAAAAGGEGLTVSLCFDPARGEAEILQDLRVRRERWPALPANQILTGAVQSRLGQMLCKYAGISGGAAAGALDDGQLAALAGALRDFRLPLTGVSGFETAQVTAGGVKTAEFDPETLGSRLVAGLYACGEVRDIDGDCGGFDLQWAWASGLLAGELR